VSTLPARAAALCIGTSLLAAGRIFAAPVEPDTTVVLAYIDPGTGSVLVQALIAAIAGIAVTTRLYWERIKVFLGLASPTDEGRDAPRDDE
jgi:hypothetical protein